MFKRIVIIISIVALCWHCVPVSVPDSSTISANELRKHVTYLAADELEGRKPGSEGGRQAADYIRQQFRSNNLELLAEDGFQQFQVVTAVKAGENNRLTFKDFTGSLGDDFTAL
ncbi:MAG: aminopeptidase, partial [Candidatus Marinimicrobia bacterium]|nr:aminopeptidase [Candidatus Neomarinimicrobiota bacterium]